MAKKTLTPASKINAPQTVRPSGADWCALYPGSTSVNTLVQPFRAKFIEFQTALTNAGITIKITATLRPPERAYLMHWSWDIAHGICVASAVPAMPGVNIDWVGDPATSISRAKDMVRTYGLAVEAVLNSRHTQGNAVDMILSNFEGKQIANKNGTMVTINQISDLYPVGATYGVIKLQSDPPHWSNDGH